MIPVREYEGQTVAVFGLARSGLASIRALKAGGARVVAHDDRKSAQDEARAAGAEVMIPERFPWTALGALVLSPGVPLTHPEPHPVVRAAQAAGVPIIGDIELFALSVGHLMTDSQGARIRPPIVCITGTNGKSTTTALLGHMLQRTGLNVQIGGNYGRPVLDFEPPDELTVYVIEMSSFQIDLTRSLRPIVAALTNVTPDHLDRHGTLENYARVKARLLNWVAKTGTAVVGIDTPPTEAIFTDLWSKNGRRIVPVSVGKALGFGIFVLNGILYDGTRSPAIEVEDLRTLETLKGAHNWQNAAIAFACADALGRDRQALARGMRAFPGLAHRMEIIADIAGIRCVNDSKGTNADATEKALVCYDPIYWIAGGIAKEGGIASLAPHFSRIAKAYLIGKAAESYARTLEGAGVPFVMAGDVVNAARLALADAVADARRGATLLLSPASASFDQFKDFEQRGEAFRAVIKQLAAERGGELPAMPAAQGGLP